MKKLLTNLLVAISMLICCLSFASCGETSQNPTPEPSPQPEPDPVYQTVENKIKAIKDVQFSDILEIENIESAQNAYNALSATDKAKVSNHAILTEKIDLLPYMKQFAKMAVLSFKTFNKSLKDPSSLIIEEDSRARMWMNESSGNIVYRCLIQITYNAKNSYGGYAGVTSSFIEWDDYGFISVKDKNKVTAYLLLWLFDEPHFTLDKNGTKTEGVALLTKATVIDIIAGKYDKFAQ